MPQNDKTAMALEESIAKYQAIVDRLKGGDSIHNNTSSMAVWKSDNQLLNLGSAGCALCKVYFHMSKCQGCPLKNANDWCMDDESSYQIFRDAAKHSGSAEEQLEAAEKMLAALVSCRG